MMFWENDIGCGLVFNVRTPAPPLAGLAPHNACMSSRASATAVWILIDVKQDSGLIYYDWREKDGRVNNANA